MRKNYRPKPNDKKNLHKFFYQNCIYMIDMERFNLVMEKLEIESVNLKNAKNIEVFLKKNKLLIQEFLELISICWVRTN